MREELGHSDSCAAGCHSRLNPPSASPLPKPQLLRALPPPAACQLAGAQASLHRCAVKSLSLAAYIQYVVVYSLPLEGEGGQGLTRQQHQFVQSVAQQGAAAFHAWQEAIQLCALLVHAAVDAGVGGGGGSAAVSSGLARFFFEGHCAVLENAVMGLHNSMLVLQRALSNELPLRPPIAAILAGCPAAAGATLDTAERLLRLVANWARLAEVVRAALPGMDEGDLSEICSVQRLLVSARDYLDMLRAAFQDRPLFEVVLPGTAGEQLKRVGSLVASAVKAGRCIADIPEQARGATH